MRCSFLQRPTRSAIAHAYPVRTPDPAELPAAHGSRCGFGTEPVPHRGDRDVPPSPGSGPVETSQQILDVTVGGMQQRRTQVGEGASGRQRVADLGHVDGVVGREPRVTNRGEQLGVIPVCNRASAWVMPSRSLSSKPDGPGLGGGFHGSSLMRTDGPAGVGPAGAALAAPLVQGTGLARCVIDSPTGAAIGCCSCLVQNQHTAWAPAPHRARGPDMSTTKDLPRRA